MSQDDIQRELLEHRYRDFEVLNSEPMRFAQYTIYLVATILLVLLGWAIVAKSPVIVTVTGQLQPESEMTRIYVPVSGHASEIHLVAGQPVSAGDVVMRVRSSMAMDLGKRAQQARLKYDNALAQKDRNSDEYPVLQRQIERVGKSIESLDKELNLQSRERSFNLNQVQAARFESLQNRIESAKVDAALSYKNWRKMERLVKQGAVSEQSVDQAHGAYNRNKRALDEARNGLIQYELNLVSESRQQRDALALLSERLDNKYRERDELQAKLRAMNRQDRNIENEIELARIEMDISSRVSFDDIDSNGLLLVRSPVDGVIAEVGVRQTGQPVDSASPVASIAPEGSKKVLQIDINEKDRLFLREGMLVRIKFNAMDYRRYGVAEGTLQYISPSTVSAAAAPGQTAPRAVYRGRVSIHREGLNLQGAFYAFQYGMQARAEIVVRERRVIDIVLDPMREVIY